ncbi:MAG TPA: hypothetical protein VGX76_08260, partial [Pirellulales bacterium]|nr:hypothetical protein [Pirellulales bacterium]
YEPALPLKLILGQKHGVSSSGHDSNRSRKKNLRGCLTTSGTLIYIAAINTCPRVRANCRKDFSRSRVF